MRWRWSTVYTKRIPASRAEEAAVFELLHKYKWGNQPWPSIFALSAQTQTTGKLCSSRFGLELEQTGTCTSTWLHALNGYCDYDLHLQRSTNLRWCMRKSFLRFEADEQITRPITRWLAYVRYRCYFMERLKLIFLQKYYFNPYD